MKLDMRDPESIASWYSVAPQRHAAFLRWALQQDSHRAFWPAIEASRELVQSKKTGVPA